MSEITPEHKAAFREARQAAIDAVAKLNAIFAETDRTYRAEIRMVPYWPDGAFDDDDASDGEPLIGTGRERAESEDEGTDL